MVDSFEVVNRRRVLENENQSMFSKAVSTKSNGEIYLFTAPKSPPIQRLSRRRMA